MWTLAVPEEQLATNTFGNETILGTGDQRKPLLCQWYYPGCLGLRNPLDIDVSQLHIISCVIASKKVNDMENRMTLRLNGSVVQWYYVQGSADDHELWLTNEICEGKLDPRFFWNHIYTSSDIIDPNSNMIYDWLGDDQLIAKMNSIWTNYAQLLSTKNGILPDISNVDKEDNKTGISFGIINSSVEYAELVDAFKGNVDQVIVFSTKYEILNPRKAKVFHYSLESGKKSSRQLRDIFPVLLPQLDTNLPIMVLGEDDTDLAALVVLILLSQNYDDDWCRCQRQQRPNKDTVRRHLRLLLNVRRVNPSRNTLQSVNAYIM
ncbi:uncharacterized protein KQ657_001297 [Scheffersomyces spartinae]|uniref:Uncharacterized protein n=1 Tax=Scheffersomyces spartinae TaxID=45513 RepID=A0A9P7V7W1_9ASCO|nr:uncharacterized protein KQ657_001297 [Scheffersomyces spartinae]KAG7192840.1 hypothetical protein KQ657_001297 [Scheffersomyces spartinae]